MSRNLSYPENWSIIAKERKKIDGNKCVKCGTSENTQVHHVIPLNKGGDNSMANLRTLCEYHHKLEHRHMSRTTGRFRRR